MIQTKWVLNGKAVPVNLHFGDRIKIDWPKPWPPSWRLIKDEVKVMDGWQWNKDKKEWTTINLNSIIEVTIDWYSFTI